MKRNSAGSGNSQFGSMWITNGLNNQKIRCNEIIPDDWTKGRTVNGNKHTAETKEKLRQAGRLRIGELSSKFGAKHSEETKEKISQSNKGRSKTEEHKQKISEAHKRRIR